MAIHKTNVLGAINAAIREEMISDTRTIVFGQDVGRSGGVFRATEGLIDEFGPHRIIDAPLSEAGIVGAALGMGIGGLRPIVEIQFLGFTHQAFHQIASQLARIRFRSGGRLAAPVTIRAPFGGLVGVPEHHADSIEAQFVQAPGLKIVAPSSAQDAYSLLRSSIRSEDPVLFLEPLRGYRRVRGDVDHTHSVELGRANVIRRGTDVTLISWSMPVHTCIGAADELESEGISAEVVDIRSIVPLDFEAIMESVENTKRAVVVHEATLSSGFGAEITSRIQEALFHSLVAPVFRVASWDIPYPPAAFEEHYIPSSERIMSAARQSMEQG